MARPIPTTIETFTFTKMGDDGTIEFMAATAFEDTETPGFDGTLVPMWTLSDRGTFWVPGAFKKTARERLKLAPVLFEHWTDENIGKHTQAFEDAEGFKIRAAVNEGVQRGAEVMSNLRFGTPFGLSIGQDRMADRSGTPADDKKLDRKSAPDYWQNVPINELRAITEVRWWESSVVTFAGVAPAKPSEIRSAGGEQMEDTLAALISALDKGELAAEQLETVRAIVAASEKLQASGADPNHSPNPADEAPRDVRGLLAVVSATRARLSAQGISI